MIFVLAFLFIFISDTLYAEGAFTACVEAVTDSSVSKDESGSVTQKSQEVLENIIIVRYQERLFDSSEYDIIDVMVDNDLEIFQLLIDSGLDPNVERNGRLHYSTLMYAVRKNKVQMVDILLNAGADATFRNRDSFTLLHLVKDANLANDLIDRGIDVQAQNTKGRTPLHTVENADVARVLIEHGAEVNAQDYRDRTPLDFVIPINSRKIIKVLVSAGARRNGRGMTDDFVKWIRSFFRFNNSINES